MKHSLRVAAGLAVTLVLAGCASDAPDDSVEETRASADGCSPSGAEVESIEILGEFGDAPEVTFDAPVSAVLTQRLVVIEGDGPEVADGDILSIDYSLYNAATGDLIEESGYSEVSPTVLTLDTQAPSFVGVSLTAACSTVGSRVAGLIPPSEAFGPDGAPEFGLEAGQSLLFIVDVVGIKPPPEPPLERIEGEPVDPPEGFPSVTYDEQGAPTVTIPDGEVPTEFAVTTVVKGDGVEVAGGDVVVVHYHGVNWNTGEVFDSSWERGEPASFPTGGVIPGFRDGLIGQSVGSRVIIVIPAELGYGPSGGTSDGSIGPTDTIVFVVDILGVQ
ncbi:MAG: FKBP-type peptidyl-prolyl cis-trans isomerase [Pontimonas sp.]